MKKKSLLCAFLAIAALTCLFTGALFTASAAPLPKNDTFGKKVVEQFVQSGYRGDDYTRKTSSEIGVHDMIALNMSPSGGMSFLEFTTDEYKNWESVKYFMFYVDNTASSASALGAIVNAAGGKNFSLGASSAVYTDNGTVKKANVSTFAMASGYGISVEAGFKGFVKIPFNGENLLPHGDTTGDLGTSVDKVSFCTTRSNKNAVYVSTVAVSYDDDITKPFDGSFINRANALKDISGEDNTVNVIPDFWKRNKNRDWFDGKDGMGVYSSLIEYADDNSYMHMVYSVAGNKTMWGEEDLDPMYYDWSAAKYMFMEVKNNTDYASSVGFLFSENKVGNNSEHWTLGEQYCYYLRSKSGEITSDISYKARYVTLPAHFDGYALVPVRNIVLDEYPENKVFDLDNMNRMSINFDGGASGDMTFGKFGYAVSDNILTDKAINFVDTSEYSTYEFEENDGRENKLTRIRDWVSSQDSAAMSSQFQNGASGKVTFESGAMRIKYNVGTSNDSSTLWLKEFAAADRNWTEARCLVIDIKNNTDTAVKTGFYVSEGTSANPEHFVINNGANLYFRSRNDGGTAVNYVPYSHTYINVPASFDGWLVIPLNDNCLKAATWNTSGNGKFDKVNIYCLSLIMYEKNDVDLSYGGLYLANSNRIVNPANAISEIINNDTSTGTFTVNAESKVYDGAPATVGVTDAEGTATYEYYDIALSPIKLESAPINAGHYKVIATVAGLTGEAEYYIYKAEPAFALKAAPEELFAGDAIPALLESGAGTLVFEATNLKAGTNNYTYVFRPTDTVNYKEVRGSVTLTAKVRESGGETEEPGKSGCSSTLGEITWVAFIVAMAAVFIIKKSLKNQEGKK